MDTLSDLLLVDGSEQTIHLVDMVSAQWVTFGHLLGLCGNQLEAWRQDHLNSCGSCWKEVMEYWLKMGASEPCDYPRTWEGLYNLLRDAEYAEVAKLLEEAVSAAAKTQ